MIDKYSRQSLFFKISEEGQKKLDSICVGIVGCGAIRKMER